MLKGEQLANTVKQDNIISIQVNHLVKPHHPDTILGSINPNFVQTIQSKRNASMLYFNKMKLLQADELDRSLLQYQKKKQLTQIEKENDRKDYRQRVNGVLGDIEKNMMARSMMFQSQLYKQSEKQSRFIDDHAIKQRKISQLIDKNIDPSMFNRQSDRYRQYQTLQHSRTLQTMQMQKKQLQRRREEERRARQLQIREREQYERRLEQQKLRHQQQRMKNRMEYRMDLQKLVEEKREKEIQRPQPVMDYRRHNPITNPIEYHIDNPYILKRLQRYN